MLMRNKSGMGNVQKGFLLIEILVALILLTVAILGSVKLASITLKSADSAISRQKAITSLEDVIARMRVNGINNYLVDTSKNGKMSCATSKTTSDLQSWLRQLDCSIPGATAVIQKTNGSDVSISIIWDDSRGQLSKLTLSDETYRLSLSTSIM